MNWRKERESKTSQLLSRLHRISLINFSLLSGALLNSLQCSYPPLRVGDAYKPVMKKS